MNDVVGAQIVSIPAQLAQDHAVATQRTIMIWLGGVLAGCWASINLLVYVFYKRNAFAKPFAPATAAG